MSLINLFNYISADINLTSDDIFYIRIREITSFSSNVNFRLTLSVFNRNIDEISVGNRPDSFVLHIIDSVHIFYFIQNFNFEKHRIDFGK